MSVIIQYCLSTLFDCGFNLIHFIIFLMNSCQNQFCLPCAAEVLPVEEGLMVGDSEVDRLRFLVVGLFKYLIVN